MIQTTIWIGYALSLLTGILILFYINRVLVHKKFQSKKAIPMFWIITAIINILFVIV